MENFGKTQPALREQLINKHICSRYIFLKFKLRFRLNSTHAFVSERSPSAFLRINLLELMYVFNVL